MKHDEPDDQQLRDGARQLGIRAADRLDPERTAQAVLARLKEQPVARRPAYTRPAVWLRVAAMLVVVIGSALVVRLVRAPSIPAIPTALTSVDTGLGDLTPGELRAMLRVVDDSSLDEASTATTAPGLDDLSVAELRRLLQSLEG